MPAQFGFQNFKETKVKTSSNVKKMHEVLLTARQNVKKLSKFIVSDIFKFWNNQCPEYFNEVLCPVEDNGVATRPFNQKIEISLGNAKLGMQSLPYVGFNTWNKLPNNLKTTSSVNCFKHNIKKYFLNKLSKTEADIYSFV